MRSRRPAVRVQRRLPPGRRIDPKTATNASGLRRVRPDGRRHTHPHWPTGRAAADFWWPKIGRFAAVGDGGWWRTLWSIRCFAQLLVATARGIGDPPPRSEVPQAVRRNHLRPQPFAASRESATTQAIGRLSRRCAERKPVSVSPAVHQLWLANDHRP